ncbi:MAG TPA: hypothetical protein VLG44_01705 [Chlamydiales bacterium]|nr:hypothetical protein [Chlamydiales bacterium]
MKWKIFGLVIFILMLVVVAFGVFFWTYKKEIIEKYISRSLHLPVTISRVEYGNGKIAISNLWVGNPHGFHSKTAFSCNRMTLSSLQVQRGKLIIDTIEMNDLFVDIENRHNETNWDVILSAQVENKKKYLISNLILRNFNLTTIDANGQAKEYPVLPAIEFHNLSDALGMPLERALLTAIYREALNIKSEVPMQ